MEGFDPTGASGRPGYGAFEPDENSEAALLASASAVDHAGYAPPRRRGGRGQRFVGVAYLVAGVVMGVAGSAAMQFRGGGGGSGASALWSSGDGPGQAEGELSTAQVRALHERVGAQDTELMALRAALEDARESAADGGRASIATPGPLAEEGEEGGGAWKRHHHHAGGKNDSHPSMSPTGYEKPSNGNPLPHPTLMPSSEPTADEKHPLPHPTLMPSSEPTADAKHPLPHPTLMPSSEPTKPPKTHAPSSEAVTSAPTDDDHRWDSDCWVWLCPSPAPSVSPTYPPTFAPTWATPLPSQVPTPAPTMEPTTKFVHVGSPKPSNVPSPAPTDEPSHAPTDPPTTPAPSAPPPTPAPSAPPPTPAPTHKPTNTYDAPTPVPTSVPTSVPTPAPIQPTPVPTHAPSNVPTPAPTYPPSIPPTAFPSATPTLKPTTGPTLFTPTPKPSAPPSILPTPVPTPAPSSTSAPSGTFAPTPGPSFTLAPTPKPTPTPTTVKSHTPAPSALPTSTPTLAPPTMNPTEFTPTPKPSVPPTSANPTFTWYPSQTPTHVPTPQPTEPPSFSPTPAPNTPSPSFHPSQLPTGSPTRSPTTVPSPAPTPSPTYVPSPAPSTLPTSAPSTFWPTPVPSTIPSPQPTQVPTDFGWHTCAHAGEVGHYLFWCDTFCGDDPGISYYVDNGKGDWVFDIDRCYMRQNDPAQEVSTTWFGSNYRESLKWHNYYVQMMISTHNRYSNTDPMVGDDDDYVERMRDEAHPSLYVRAYPSTTGEEVLGGGYEVGLRVWENAIYFYGDGCGGKEHTQHISPKVLNMSAHTSYVLGVDVQDTNLHVFLDDVFYANFTMEDTVCTAGSIGFVTSYADVTMRNLTVANSSTQLFDGGFGLTHTTRARSKRARKAVR